MPGLKEAVPSVDIYMEFRESFYIGYIHAMVPALLHINNCANRECADQSCKRMKKAIAHLISCRLSKKEKCFSCHKTLALISYHALLECKDPECEVFMCNAVKLSARDMSQEMRSELLQVVRARPDQALRIRHTSVPRPRPY